MLNNKTIDYEAMIQKALRQIVKDVLAKTAKEGLIGNHHFYITFATNHPWVELPDHLRAEYPEEMVIVLQHEFWDLEVSNDKFSVTLGFDDMNERITVPFMALINFVDPSVKFGLQFIPGYDSAEDSFESDSKTEPTFHSSKTNIVSLDDFRKK